MAADTDSFDDRSTVLHKRVNVSSIPDSAFRLVVIEGPERGVSLLIDGTEPARVLVGQGPACGLRLSDPSVSRRHAAIELEEAGLRITDLGSKNGTEVNGVSVLEAVLRGGEVIRLGATALRAELEIPTERGELSTETEFGLVVGLSTEMRRLYPLCQALAASNVPVIIEGETGTGKELLAESLHLEGPRRDGPFVIFDCTSVPANLVESELFGHERGAFTSAVAARQGLFELADKGTLLIDEIGDLDQSLQPKLLRVLERGEVRRVGANRVTRVDVRVLAATRRDLDREVMAGRFRDDLFHRLAVARIEMPPLRKRRGDIPVLVRHLVNQLGGDTSRLPPELIGSWEALPWPGNVRELRNAVARHLALGALAGHGPALSPAPPGSWSAAVDEAAASLLDLGLSEARQRIIDTFDRAYVRRVLERHDGNVTRAAVASGIGRRYFQLLKARDSDRER